MAGQKMSTFAPQIGGAMLGSLCAANATLRWRAVLAHSTGGQVEASNAELCAEMEGRFGALSWLGAVLQAEPLVGGNQPPALPFASTPPARQVVSPSYLTQLIPVSNSRF